MLSLGEVEQGHDGCFFVLRWVAFQNLSDELLVDSIEVEGDLWVVFRCVAMLQTLSDKAFLGLIAQSEE